MSFRLPDRHCRGRAAFRRPVAASLAALCLAWAVLLPRMAVADANLVAFWKQEWPKTDFAKASVPLTEIVAGGPPRDGIPPIDAPRFETGAQAGTWLGNGQPVVVLADGASARAYPLAVLIWHEIVNDTVGGVPVAVAFCPLCNSALAFDRRVGGRVLDFGTTGKLRNSDLVMWDRQTESWWQQMTGEAIVGDLAGTRLTPMPAPVVAFETFRAAFPLGRVLSRETGHDRPYGRNPYEDYDRLDTTQPFLLRGRPDGRLRPMERVLGLASNGKFRAYPFSLLAKQPVAHDRLGGGAVVIFYQPGMRSVLDQGDVQSGRPVGSAAAFRPEARGRALHFELREGAIMDRETASRWSTLGRAVAGPLQGEQLPALPHDTPFAFAWLAFHPDSDVWTAR